MPTNPLPALYDFLYRDSARITSYVAQLHARQAAGAGPGGAGARLPEAAGSAGETPGGRGDAPADLIAALLDSDRVQRDLNAAPHGALVFAQGTLVWVDRHLLELARTAFEVLISQEEARPAPQRNLANLQGLRFVKAFLEKMPLPSAFLLETTDGRSVAGTIKDEGMEEPIATYYFKHGTAGLGDVYLLGIKELPSTSFVLPSTQLFGAGQQAAQALGDMLFPKGAVRVTPVALFRAL
jgi:hypothetical protein